MESLNHASNIRKHQQIAVFGVRASPSVNTIREEIRNFNNLRKHLTEKLKLKKWFVVTTQKNLHIFNLNRKLNGNLSIRNTICIDVDLVVTVFREDDNILFTVKLHHWPQLQTLIDQLEIVKREDDPDSVRGPDKDRNCEATRREVRDGNGFDQQEETATFEFCETNANTDANDFNQQLEECTVTTASDNIDSFLKVECLTLENKPTNDAEPQSDFFDESLFVCFDCGAEFDRNSELIAHMSVHESQTCPVCNEMFTGTMDLHMQLHFNGSRYQCHICGRKYQNLHPLQKHMQSEHFTGNDEFYCDICKDGKDFRTKALINKHMYKKHQRRKEKEPPKLSQLEWVLMQAERMQKKNEICSDSNNSSTKSAVRENRNHGSGQDESKKASKLKQCPICNKRYTQLFRHIRNVHEKDSKNHICHICGNAYAELPNLRQHITIKHSDGESFTCEICRNGKIYRSKAYLRKHLALVHAKSIQLKSGAKPDDVKRFYKCHLCDEELPSQYTLTTHLFFKHNESATSLQCKVCYKKFAMRSSLVLHQKLHIGKIHLCSECGKSFNHPNYLRKHINKQHKEKKKKECTMCEKQYANMLDLRLHMKKVHNVILPVKTTQCTVKQYPNMYKDLHK